MDNWVTSSGLSNKKQEDLAPEEQIIEEQLIEEEIQDDENTSSE